MREEILAKVHEVAQRVGESEGIEIVEVEMAGSGHGRVLRIYIDRLTGVTHSDCELISQQVGTILDVEGTVPGSGYTLEVSSPGVERKLSRPQDFARFQGQKVKITLREPVENRRNWEGVLARYQEGVLTLEPAPGQEISFSMQQIQRANLKFEW
jgi:ribosome maturation factor RimP